MILLAEPEAKDDGVGRGALSPRLLRCGVLLGVALVPVGRLVVDGDGLLVAADLEHRVLRELGLLHPRLRIEQDHARADRARERGGRPGRRARRSRRSRRACSHCGGSFCASGVAPYFSQSSKYALPPFSKSSSALLPPLPASSTIRCARRRWMSHCTFVRMVQVSSFFAALVAGAEHVDELRHVGDHVVDARVAVRRPVEREDVDALEVELRRVHRRVVVGVVVARSP